MANGMARLGDQLQRLFVHAYHRTTPVVRASIDLQNLLYAGDELSILLWRNRPADSAPRLQGIVCNARRTVS